MVQKLLVTEKLVLDSPVQTPRRQLKYGDVPVVVLGTGITALGVLRAFGRAGIPTLSVSKWLEFVGASRFSHKPDGNLNPLADGADLPAFLKKLPYDNLVLCACTDDWTRAVSRLGSELQNRYLASISEPQTMDLFLEKEKFLGVLAANHIPHPRTTLLRSEADLEALPDEYYADSFLKPSNSQFFFKQYFVKAFHVHSREDAVARYRDIRANGLAAVLQDYVPGPASNHYFIDGFVDRKGRISARFARQRLRMYPRDFGNSTYMVSIPLEEIAPAATDLRRLLESVRYRGIFSVEFKLDLRDGRLKMLDMNTRPWWYIDFARSCGVDVCVMAYCDALGLEVEPVTSYEVGKTLVYPYNDVNACFELWKEGRLSLGSWLMSWLTSRQPVFSWSDPMPSINWLAERIGAKVRAAFRR
jgi:D-aspartate ligase